jgi:hypothetical protein
VIAVDRLRLLALGDGLSLDMLVLRLSEHGIELVYEALNRHEIRGGPAYSSSDRGIELTRAASPELWDAVVIGNNHGLGLEYAREIPDEMKSRTLIVWNVFDPGGGQEQAYASLGFTNFGSRYRNPNNHRGVLCLDTFLIHLPAGAGMP